MSVRRSRSDEEYSHKLTVGLPEVHGATGCLKLKDFIVEIYGIVDGGGLVDASAPYPR